MASTDKEPGYPAGRLEAAMADVVMTAGYAGKTLEGFVALLAENTVEVLVDVRLTPISRKKGFSKTALREALEAAGIRYVHARDLGNPKEFRTRASSVSECLDLYSGYMAERWSEVLSPLAATINGGRACLLCFESDPAECHRSIVAPKLADTLGSERVVNL